jgi:hypothetical protein
MRHMFARRDERFVKPGELPCKLAIECATVAQGLAARAPRRAWECEQALKFDQLLAQRASKTDQSSSDISR